MRLKQIRKSRKLKQRDVAEAINCSQAVYSRYESEERTMSPAVLNALADFFGVSVDYLMGREDEAGENKQEDEKKTEQPAETSSALDRELKAAVDQLPDDASKQDVIDYILFKLGRSKK